MEKLKKSIMGKYNAGDVDKLLQKVREDYEQCLKNQKERILLLRDENKDMAGMLEAYKRNEQNILSAITHAEEKAQSIIRQAKEKAALCLENAQREAQSIRSSAECYYQRLCSLKKASETIHKAFDKVINEERTNVRPFVANSDKTQTY
ncbi:MAG: DivIVA domain-containing protein [Christensenellales bacterium]